ncbi:MAG: DUF5818 domain-containing protein [Candidatus Sulfotelmatobacter sp.]
MRHLLMFSVLLLGMSWAAAQNYPSQGSTGNTSGQQTVKGCLSSSGGTYTLTDKSGKTFQLAGDTAKLSDHVGHEIKVTGTVSSSSASSSDATGQTGAGQPTLEVSSVKHISKTCEGGGMSK